MTTAEKIANVKVRVENDPAATDEVLAVYLSDAERDILRRLYRAYGYVPEGTVLPGMWEVDQCDLAARRFLRRGGQAEIAHSENGVNRTYHSTDDEEILKNVIPYAKVMS